MFDSLNISNTDIFSNLTRTSTFGEPEVELSEKEKILNFLTKGQEFLMLLGIFATPFFFLPLALEWFEQAKIVFVSVMFGLVVAKFLLTNIFGKKQQIVSTIIDKYLLFVLASVCVSAFLSSNQWLLRIPSLLAEPVQFFSLTVVFFVITNTVKKMDQWKMAATLLTWSIVGIGTISSIQILVGLLTRFIPPLRTFVLANPLLVNFSPTGGLFIEASLLVLVLPLIVGLYNQKQSKKSKTAHTVLLVSSIISIVAIGWMLFVSRPILMDHDTARKIATGVLGKSYLSALFGLGPNNYVSAFSQYRGVDYNLTSLWDKSFATSSNLWFYLLTIGGLVTTAGMAGLTLKIGSFVRSRLKEVTDWEKYLFASLGILVVVSLFFPMSYLVLFTAYVLLGLTFSYYHIEKIGQATKELDLTRPVTFEVLGAVMILAGLSVYGQTVAMAGDIYFRKSLEASSKNLGIETYNLQIKASQTTPWKDSYRVSLSQTNLALADSLAAKKGLSDQEKQTIVQLVQQALAESRNAVALNPSSSVNLSNLANVYRSLINFAQGSDQWAIQTQLLATTLNPFDPRLRLELGGTYFSLGDFQNAAQNFGQAIQLKPDYANAHYNLAQALKQLKIFDRALSELQTTQQYVCANPASQVDCDKIKQEINDLTNPKPEEKPQAANTEVPSPTPSIVSPAASPSGAKRNLPNAKTQPPVKIGSPSGELVQ
jgi:tetratricopeptide (TPR) repeat protein